MKPWLLCLLMCCHCFYLSPQSVRKLEHDFEDAVTWTRFDLIGFKHRNPIFRIGKLADSNFLRDFDYSKDPINGIIFIIIIIEIVFRGNFLTAQWNQHQLGRPAKNVKISTSISFFSEKLEHKKCVNMPGINIKSIKSAWNCLKLF